MSNESSEKIEIDIETHSGFGPFVLKMSVTEAIAEDFNIAYEQIVDFGKEDEFVFSRAEEDSFSKRLTIPFDVLKGYSDFFQQTVSAYIKLAKGFKCDIFEDWKVVFTNAYVATIKNGDHIPSRSGSANQLSCISFIHESGDTSNSEIEIKLSMPGAKSPFYRDTFKITPKLRDMYVFPSCFQVSMSPVKSSEDFAIRIFEGWMEISEDIQDEWPLLHNAGDAKTLDEIMSVGDEE
tara:strand:+ start:2107 stop:2814 length:708 start_codon:yes stop_codon:yes gene_type:complete